MKHPLSLLGLALSISACGLANGVCAAEHLGAAPEFLSVTGPSRQSVTWQAVDDDVLAHQTGKYAGASMISGFVLNVLSQWRLPNGTVASAQGSLTVTTNANNVLSAQVATAAQVSSGGSGGTGANPFASTTGGQRVSVSGVSQVTQVAGDNNAGMNSAVIDFSGALAQPVVNGNAPSASASNATGSVKANVTFGSGGVMVALQTPAGIATQSVVPGNTQQAGSIAQLVQIAGNGQAVSNQLQLSLVTQQLSASTLRQVGALQALQNTIFSRK